MTHTSKASSDPTGQSVTYIHTVIFDYQYSGRKGPRTDIQHTNKRKGGVDFVISCV